MADADGASKFADLARLQVALDDLNGKKVGITVLIKHHILFNIFLWRVHLSL